MQNNSCAVVILNYNGRQHLANFLPSVVKHTPQTLADLVVIDNNSTDDSVLFLKDHYPQIRLVCNKQNYGFAGGYNEGLKQVGAEFLLLLNSDVEVTENWLQPLLVQLRNPRVAAVQPRVLSWHRRNEFEHAGASGGYIDKYGYPFCRGRILHITEVDSGQYREPVEVFWASGACMLIRNDAFRKAGGFDADFFAHMEEIDLCWRLKNQGYSICCEPASVVYHLGGGTLSTLSPSKTFLNFRNSLCMLTKNLPASFLLRLLPVRLLLDGVAGFSFLIQGKPGHCWAVIKAHFSFYSKFFSLLKKRRLIEKKKPHISGVYLKSVVWEFYVRRKRRFSELNPERFSKDYLPNK